MPGTVDASSFGAPIPVHRSRRRGCGGPGRTSAPRRAARRPRVRPGWHHRGGRDCQAGGRVPAAAASGTARSSWRAARRSERSRNVAKLRSARLDRAAIDITESEMHGLRPKLLLDSGRSRLVRPPRVRESVDDRAGQRAPTLTRHDTQIVSEDLVKLPASGIVGTDDGGVGAQPFGCDEAAVGSLATVTAAGARSRHEIKGPSEVQDEVSRGELVSVRAGLGPARGRDAVALCRRHGRVAPGAVRSTRRAEDVLGLCDRDGVDAPPCLPGALAPRGRLLAVGLVVAGCRSRSPRPHHALPTQSVSRGCMPPHPLERTHPSPRRQHGTVDCGRRRMGCGETRWTRPPRLADAASCW